jgi:hypothetical protein
MANVPDPVTTVRAQCRDGADEAPEGLAEAQGFAGLQQVTVTTCYGLLHSLAGVSAWPEVAGSTATGSPAGFRSALRAGGLAGGLMKGGEMSSGVRATCDKCGQPLSFVRRVGKYGVMKLWPVNPDGSEHWDLCKRIQREGIGMEAVMAKHPPACTHCRYTHVYCGAVPPWDESLGAFRDFTAAEKADATVCNKV